MTQPTLPVTGPKSVEAALLPTHEHGGAPRKRGPVGLIQAIFRGARSPSAKIWMVPLAKGAGTLVLLWCVAFIGQRARDDERYGSEISLRMPGSSDAGLLTSKAEAGAGETKPAHTQATPPPSGSEAAVPCQESRAKAPSGLLPDGRIILNEASADDLMRLPGVGPARAEAILALRTRLGRFKKLTDLLRVKGIGPKTLQRFTDHLVLDRPVEIESPEKPPTNGEGAPGGPVAGALGRSAQVEKVASATAP
jgi:competence ComEA-like helix-hairpin-helix protein